MLSPRRASQLACTEHAWGSRWAEEPEAAPTSSPHVPGTVLSVLRAISCLYLHTTHKSFSPFLIQALSGSPARTPHLMGGPVGGTLLVCSSLASPMLNIPPTLTNDQVTPFYLPLPGCQLCLPLWLFQKSPFRCGTGSHSPTFHQEGNGRGSFLPLHLETSQPGQLPCPWQTLLIDHNILAH